MSFSFCTPNPENDGKKVQDFFLTMEAAIVDHPLWDGATNEEIDNAMEVIFAANWYPSKSIASIFVSVVNFFSF